MMDAQQAEEQAAARHLSLFLEKTERDRYECQELLAYASTHWILSTDEFKVQYPRCTKKFIIQLRNGYPISIILVKLEAFSFLNTSKTT